MIVAIDARPLVTRHIAGAEQHARNIVAAWASMDTPHRFVLMLNPQWQSLPDYDPGLIQQLPQDLFTIYIPVPGRIGRLLPRHASLVRVASKLAGSDINLFHSFTAELPSRAALPMVHTIHDLACELDPQVRRTVEGAESRRIHRQGIRRAASTIAVSTQTRNDVLGVYRLSPAKVHLIFNGINPVFVPQQDRTLQRQLHAAWPLESRYVLLVGSDIPRRNYARVWQAIQKVWASDPSLRLVLAGRNVWTKSEFFKRAHASGLAERVTFIQSPTDPELAQLYRDALITCCGSSFEGFGLSVLEAMACGCPVACSDMSSLREVADDAPLYFTHDDVDSIAEAITSLAEDSEYRRQLRQRGLARASRFTWAAAAQRLLGILEQVAEFDRHARST